MYAHQVIEDCIKFNKYEFKFFYDDILKDIQTSFKFHIDDPELVLDNFGKRLTDKYIFNNEYTQYAKMPYNKIWVDWHRSTVDATNVSAIGALVEYLKNENAIVMMSFSKMAIGYCNELFKWIPESHGVKIYLKKELPNVSLIRYLDLQEHMEKKYGPESYKNFAECCEKSLRGCTHILESFLLLLNCKNVSNQKQYPSESLNKKRIKQGKQPLFTYHTLVVNPMSDKKRSDGPHEPTGIKQRLHFCRGHFKEYTEANKLFGKHTGLYWWQPMVRGNKELGIVHKDYHVKAA